ncbi:hypothetical protein PN473_19815 [Dolichospermum circinale CS-545/17]|nr:hypothetical protein [Dolichospermum circinale CS-545/17]
MNQLSKLIIAATAIGSFLSLPLGETLVQAQDAAVIQCITQYTNLGISPDAALAQCQKSNLAECVQRLISKKYVAKSVSQFNGRYLVDLGDSDTRWLEGKNWRDKGCSAHTEGQYKRQSDNRREFGGRRSYEWFRQGWCSQPQIELEQNYSVDEAKTLCELGLQPKE